MRKYVCFFVLFFVTLAADTELIAQKASDIEGLWRTDDGESHVEIYREGDTYKGKIVWLKAPKDDSGRPITDDRGDEILGMEFMDKFKYSDGAYIDGRVYDPESGKTYYGSIRPDGKNTLKLRGSLDKTGWLGRTETWTRVQS